MTSRFNMFIDTCCVIRNDVEVDSCDILSQFRIWNKVKPTRDTNEKFNTYLKTRFINGRLKNQDKNQLVHGFIGVMLKSIEYKKILLNDMTETFIFETCRFSPNNRIALSKISEEYIRYKKKMNISITSYEEDELKKYLNSCNYVQKGVIRIQETNFTTDGYYGLALKTEELFIRKITGNTGKKVEKVDIKTESVINTWETIAKAATDEKISSTKMSRNIKNKIMFSDYYYR